MLAIPNILFGIVGFIKGPYKPRSWTFSIEVEVSISKARYVSSEKNEGGFWGYFSREYEIKPKIPFFVN